MFGINKYFLYFSTVIEDRKTTIIYNILENIQAILNRFCYSLQTLRSSAVTERFFICLLYELYRRRKFQSLNQKQRFNQLTCKRNSVSNVKNYNSRPVGTPKAGQCHLDMQLRANSKGIMGKGLDQIRGMINVLTLINPSTGI